MNAATSGSKVFTPFERHRIDALAIDLGRCLDAEICAEYGETDEGEEWAALTANLEMLVTFAAGAGTSGGHVILDGSGRCVGSPRGTLETERLLRVARKTAAVAFRRIAIETC
ncbi:hypothetical protein [Variovorax sp. V15]|uniref:hypothetical protein n=1 Tax=Variovorax sp. V15 TaxID=3065952 RepID=UPI0034E8F7D7